MIVKSEKLKAYLFRHGMTAADLASDMKVSHGEVEKLLTGQKVGLKTARQFIYYFDVEDSQLLIDWTKLGVSNPLAD